MLPHLGAHAGRAHSGAAEGGDVTFEIDEHAEARMEAFLAERAPEVSFYSEDRGLVSPAGDRAEWVLVVDPIDGTRPGAGRARVLLRLGAPPPGSTAEPTMGDVQVGCVLELKSGAAFVAERGAGLEPAAQPLGEPLAWSGCSGPTASAAARRGRWSRCSPS